MGRSEDFSDHFVVGLQPAAAYSVAGIGHHAHATAISLVDWGAYAGENEYAADFIHLIVRRTRSVICNTSYS
jgi:hypothetical protein